MEYRGEDASRARADWGRHAPWQPSPGAGAADTGPSGSTGAWDGTAEQGLSGGYGAEGGGYGYPPQEDAYADYDHVGYGQQEYGPYDDYGPDMGGYSATGGYADPAGTGQRADYGYQQGDHAGYQQAGYGDYGEQPEPGYRGAAGGYQGGSGEYPAWGTGSGATPALPTGTGGYPTEDAGNDWYGSQPAAASGASFADTGTYTLNGRVIDEYGTGPRQALHDPVRGYPPSPAGPRGGVQLPAPTMPAPSGPQAVPHTGQQERYDDYDPYPGYGHDEPAAYPGPDPAGRAPGEGIAGGSGGYPAVADHGAYDDYGDYDGQNGYAEPGEFGDRGYGDYQDYEDADASYAMAPAAGEYDDYAPGDPSDEEQDEGTGRRRKRKGRRARASANAASDDVDSPADGADGAVRQPRLGRLRERRPLITVLAILTLGVAGAAAFIYFVLIPQSPASNPNAAGPIPTSGPMPSQQQACAKQLGEYCHIEMRSDDPTPLTVAELYPPAFANVKAKGTFTLAAAKVDKKCSNAVIGQTLISALSKGKCTQVLRASYLSGDGKIMGTIGVINLNTTNEAHYAGRVVGQNDFIAPLASAKGTASKLGQGTGVVESSYKGHYLILTWAEFTNGSKPSTTAQDKQLEQFSAALVAGTANISLSQRMVTGAPPTPGTAV